MKSASQQQILANEIDTVATELKLKENRAHITEEAKSIGLAFLKVNRRANPVTVGRASFFIVLKKVDSKADTKAPIITRNNGHNNRWWLYLYPVIERTVKSSRDSG